MTSTSMAAISAIVLHPTRLLISCFSSSFRIFRVLGHPNIKSWPELEHLQHWHDNMEGVRTKRPEYAVGSGQLEASVLEAMKQAL